MKATCGECSYYLVDAQKLTEGACLVNPPRIISWNTNKGPMLQSFNPNVPADRPACRFFLAKQVN